MTTTDAVTGAKPLRRTRELRWGSPVAYFVALLLVSVTIAPVLFIIVGGFKDNSQITVHPAAWPHPWRIVNYLEVLRGATFWHQAWNSVICAVATTVGVVVLGVMTSYVIARYDFKGKSAMYTLFAAGLMFPMTVAITPLYLLIKSFGIVNSLWGVIIPQIAFAMPITVIILVPFLRAIPKEIEEAALMDGCGRLSFFWRMVLRLSVPGLVTAGILAFVNSWNSYLLPLFVLNKADSFTLPLGVQAFASEHSVDTARVMAFTSLSMIPALVFFSLFERRIVGGLTGAVKG